MRNATRGVVGILLASLAACGSSNAPKATPTSPEPTVDALPTSSLTTAAGTTASTASKSTAASGEFASAQAVADQLHCTGFVAESPSTDTTLDNIPEPTSEGKCNTSDGVTLKIEVYGSKNDRQRAEIAAKTIGPAFLPADARIVFATGENVTVAEADAVTTSAAGEDAVRRAARELDIDVAEVKK